MIPICLGILLNPGKALPEFPDFLLLDGDKLKIKTPVTIAGYGGLFFEGGGYFFAKPRAIMTSAI